MNEPCRVNTHELRAGKEVWCPGELIVDGPVSALVRLEQPVAEVWFAHRDIDRLDHVVATGSGRHLHFVSGAIIIEGTTTVPGTEDEA